MIKIILIIICSTLMPAVYDVGEQVSIEHQERQFDVCYGTEEYGYPTLAPTLSLKDFNGFYNDNGFGGVFYVLMIGLSASWCNPCWTSIPTMAGIENWYLNKPNVKIITALGDLSPSNPSCEQWGNQHRIDYEVNPLIVDDEVSNVLWGWFETGAAWPSTVYIDHNMIVHAKSGFPSFATARSIIDGMLNECGSLCENLPDLQALFEYNVTNNTVSFNDVSEAINNPSVWVISDWLWDFGDGNNSIEKNPEHIYENDGEYTVSLTITTYSGHEAVFSEVININPVMFSEEFITPKQLEIKQNYPNPFNPSTTIDYSLPYSDIVKINVYDINGNIVDEIINEYKNIGNHSITWAPTNISSGLYFINISQNKFSEKLKLMYIK